MQTYKIGVDVGGTHTDVVLVDLDNTIIATHKAVTTDPVNVGIVQVVQELLAQTAVTAAQIKAVFLGSTYAINALLQKKDLYKVGIIRITGYQFPIPPAYDWPIDIMQAINLRSVHIAGGVLCDGREVVKIDEQEAKKQIAVLISAGVESIAVVGSFSPLYQDQEIKIKALIESMTDAAVPVTCSYQVGGVGFIQRENATICNAALKKSMQAGFVSLQSTFDSLAISGAIQVVQNNGTIIPIAEALEFPVLTVSSGTTNSFIGAAKLSGYSDAIVVDIGGTSTDIGIVVNGLTRQSNQPVDIGGIPINFRLPDMISLAIGGGSYVEKDKKGDFSVGPRSCGYNLKKEAHAWGGESLTFTDICLAARYIIIDDADISRISLSEQESCEIALSVLQKINDAVRELRGVHKNLPVILAGGGARLFEGIASQYGFIIPRHASVANAYGAACAEVSGTVDTVVELDDADEVVTDLINQATYKAFLMGANERQVRLVSKEIMPYHYMPKKIARVKITVAGPLI